MHLILILLFELAGGAAYYFAKKEINARRREQAADNRRPTEKLECRYRYPTYLSIACFFVLMQLPFYLLNVRVGEA